VKKAAKETEPDSEQAAMHFLQFGSGVVYSEPVAGNPVAPPRWTWTRLCVALFGSRVEIVEAELRGKLITKHADGSITGRIEFGPDGLPPGERTYHTEWEKPSWMRRVASWFKPKTEGARG
jgi:hypothetical protein